MPSRLEQRELVGEVADAVGQAVGQAGLAEAAVAAARPEPDGLLLEDDHPQGRVGVGQRDGGPEPGEAGPDDRDVRVEVAPQRRSRRPGRARPRASS